MLNKHVYAVHLIEIFNTFRNYWLNIKWVATWN